MAARVAAVLFFHAPCMASYMDSTLWATSDVAVPLSGVAELNHPLTTLSVDWRDFVAWPNV